MTFVGLQVILLLRSCLYDKARKNVWTVIDMKNDWKIISALRANKRGRIAEKKLSSLHA